VGSDESIALAAAALPRLNHDLTVPSGTFISVATSLIE
jgi:hypothetical protein